MNVLLNQRSVLLSCFSHCKEQYLCVIWGIHSKELLLAENHLWYDESVNGIK